MDSATRLHLPGLTSSEFRQTVLGWGWEPFRAAQVGNWVYQKLETDPARMSNLGLPYRRELADRVSVMTSRIAADQRSTDGTIKLLLDWQDGAAAETVMIPDGRRRTACVSSQVGCPVGCRFCASGIEGVKGNLTPGRIVEQILALNLAMSGTGERITHVVFMGMGEPLANYASVMQAVRVIHDPQCLNIGARRITISTVGVPRRMRELADEALPLNLAISLHAPKEDLRPQLIPWAEHFSISEILSAAREYFEKTGREVTFEYILLAGVNDRPEHARELARLCKTVRANVNLLRYNPVEGLPYERPDVRSAMSFQEILRSAHVNVHIRKSRGRDIDAACGQLRRKNPVVVPLTTTKSG